MIYFAGGAVTGCAVFLMLLGISQRRNVEKKIERIGEIRGTVICAVCRFHTEQRKTKRGWICKECGTVQPK